MQVLSKEVWKEIEVARPKENYLLMFVCILGVLTGVGYFGDIRLLFFPPIFLGAGVGLFILFAVMISDGWVKKFWCNNIIGHILIVNRNDDGSLNGLVVSRTDYYDHVDIALQVNNRINLVIPIGGWFNRPRIICADNFAGREGIDHKKYVEQWRVECVGIFQLTNSTLIMVYLNDRRGDRVRVDVGSALTVLERFGANLERLVNEWEAVVKGLLIGDNINREKIATLEKDRIAAIVVMEDAVRKLDDAKRFIKSTQAQAIRLALIAEILKRLASDDPRRTAYEAQLVKVPAATKPTIAAHP